MKKRTGFVSNSSSSSFVCQICGREESGWDMCMDEADMKGCEYGHIMCKKHDTQELSDAKIVEAVIAAMNGSSHYQDRHDELVALRETMPPAEWVEYVLDNDEDWVNELTTSEMPESFCPICQFEKMIPQDIAQYLMIKHDMTEEKVADEIRAKFENYKSFREHIRENR